MMQVHIGCGDPCLLLGSYPTFIHKDDMHRTSSARELMTYEDLSATIIERGVKTTCEVMIRWLQIYALKLSPEGRGQFDV